MSKFEFLSLFIFNGVLSSLIFKLEVIRVRHYSFKIGIFIFKFVNNATQYFESLEKGSSLGKDFELRAYSQVES